VNFFNENDIECIVDVGIRELEFPHNEVSRVQILKTLIICMKNKDYISLNEHRVADVLAALDN